MCFLLHPVRYETLPCVFGIGLQQPLNRLNTYCSTDNPTQRLSQIVLTGMVFDQLGETTDSVHKLVAVMAKARMDQQQLAG